MDGRTFELEFAKFIQRFHEQIKEAFLKMLSSGGRFSPKRCSGKRWSKDLRTASFRNSRVT